MNSDSRNHLLLEILIPTYNRHKYLSKNLTIVLDAIKSLDLSEKVGVVVSDNCSPDETSDILKDFHNKFSDSSVSFVQLNQTENIGLEKNTLATLQNSRSSFCMFLGDDDFLQEGYLKSVIKQIETNDQLGGCIPAAQWIDPDGNLLKGGRDLELAPRLFDKGEQSAIMLIPRGQSMSGLVFKRNDTLETYLNGYRNIYPFMYFLSWNALRGDIWHETRFPMLISTVPLSWKDWDYGSDGLFDARFANSRAVFENNSKFRLKAEKKILEFNVFVLRSLLKNKRLPNAFIKRFISLKNASFGIKLFFFYYLFKEKVKSFLNRPSLYGEGPSL